MHCALIGTHTGDLNVENVTLAGTVGSVVNDAGSSSGALVCCCIYGPINETNVAQLEIDGLTLDGLKVDGGERQYQLCSSAYQRDADMREPER